MFVCYIISICIKISKGESFIKLSSSTYPSLAPSTKQTSHGWFCKKTTAAQKTSMKNLAMSCPVAENQNVICWILATFIKLHMLDQPLLMRRYMVKILPHNLPHKKNIYINKNPHRSSSSPNLMNGEKLHTLSIIGILFKNFKKKNTFLA